MSFTASEGETIGVVGHNGSGKSTLFRAMAGLIPTVQGAIWARDRPVLLGVNAALLPDLSGENNIKLGLQALGFTAAEAAAHVDEIADFAELNEFIHHPMRTYSAGMGARLRFAIASAKAHSILLVDEALAVGDRRFRTKSEERIRSLKENAGLVMIVSHSAGALKDTCERVLWIHKGEMRADGPAESVINEYIRWTKRSRGAVGAASPTKAKARGSSAAQPVPVAEAPSDVVSSDESPDEISAFERFLALVSAAAGPDDQPFLDDEPSTHTVPQTRAERSSTLERRRRHRRTAHARARRRMIIYAITGGAILLAAGAGAALALLASLPNDAEPASSPSSHIGSETAQIALFEAASSTIIWETTSDRRGDHEPVT
ncbi:MAG: ABC transporter ATP-binding protein [Microbacterium sp.]